MAGDWIKMRTNLRSHPKIVRMVSALKADEFADRLRVVGGLHAVWCLFDEHSEDGVLWGYTPEALDDEIGWPGFARNLITVGWLSWDGGEGLTLPGFDTHNGASAKRRAQEADRKRTERAEAKGPSKDDRNPSASDADKKRTREEKRREEENTTPPGFVRFWETWPKSQRKEAKGKCLEAWRKAGAESQADRIVAHVESLKRSQSWTKDGGQYIPAPLVYLNNRRWEGADAANDDDPYGLRSAL